MEFSHEILLAETTSVAVAWIATQAIAILGGIGDQAAALQVDGERATRNIHLRSSMRLSNFLPQGFQPQILLHIKRLLAAKLTKVGQMPESVDENGKILCGEKTLGVHVRFLPSEKFELGHFS